MGQSYTLVIGDKNYSSWSLRPWLAMRRAGIEFREQPIMLRTPGTRDRILEPSPSGLVPALKTGEVDLWDSLAILEYLAEAHPDAELWPAERSARALARAVSAEMHSGFSDLRDQLPMDFVRRRTRADISDAVAGNVRRIVEIWRQCRSAHGGGGGFLFGAFSIADAMYAPVVSRLQSYGVDLAAHGDDSTALAYRDHVRAMRELDLWARDAAQELQSRGETV